MVEIVALRIAVPISICWENRDEKVMDTVAFGRLSIRGLELNPKCRHPFYDYINSIKDLIFSSLCGSARLGGIPDQVRSDSISGFRNKSRFAMSVPTGKIPAGSKGKSMSNGPGHGRIAFF